MYARVPQAMAQFVLKIELLSHIMGTAPILEMARAYGLRPRLWLLVILEILAVKDTFDDNTQPDELSGEDPIGLTLKSHSVS